MIKIKSKDIITAINIISPAVVSGGNIKIVCSDNQLKLISSNNRMQIESLCDAECDDSGELCINSDKFIGFIKSCDDKDIKITRNANNIVLKSKVRSTINIIDSSSFPEIKISTENIVALRIDADAFESVSYAAATDDYRVFLNGISIKCDDGSLNIIASNASRSASTVINVDNTESIECIIQQESVRAISKVFKGEVDLLLNKNCFSVTDGSSSIIGKNIDAKFPTDNFVRVINADRMNKAFVCSKELLSAISSVVFINKDITMSFGNDIITLSVENRQGEDATIDVACSYKGDEISIGIASNYLVDSLKKFSGEVSINMADNSSMAICGDDNESIHLISGKII